MLVIFTCVNHVASFSDDAVVQQAPRSVQQLSTQALRLQSREQILQPSQLLVDCCCRTHLFIAVGLNSSPKEMKREATVLLRCRKWQASHIRCTTTGLYLFFSLRACIYFSLLFFYPRRNVINHTSFLQSTIFYFYFLLIIYTWYIPGIYIYTWYIYTATSL